ncbi:hypothetical protein GV828_03850 [Flavobacterium sp. NST-5]|uniref:DUF2271 domain-containing protein n=1 Tax=Flavobacterium ichthyis TaxID=2698827 RepID=A0ABW9Z6Q0_9FLAO|nr:hypothetical protein [Flavobacterium ichthyis]NBL64334.1 hypothetical protein [Flavobacterium ichthyis]
MKQFLFFFLLISFSAKSQVGQHCGYDFTSYFVLNVHEDGSKKHIPGLKISVVNIFGTEVANINNMFSWTDGGKPLIFTENYKIDDQNQRLQPGENAEKERWFFPFAKENYLLSVKNTFPADEYSIKVEDIDGDANGGNFATQIVKLYNFNMYVLCAGKARETQFGPKMNRPIEIVMMKK